MKRRLKRVTEKGWIGGVCPGVAYWLGMPSWLVRLAWFWFLVAWPYGFGLVTYILLWIFMPVWDETPADYSQVTGD